MNRCYQINSDWFVNEAISIIEELDTPFNSHEFIKKFAEKNEAVYVEWLYNAKNCKKGAFWNVHAEIGRKLMHCSITDILPIRKIREVKDINIFGNPDKVVEWKKL